MRNFVGANGGVIENHGYADTNMKPTDDKGPEIRFRWDCAEVTRPLISTGVTCDSGCEVEKRASTRNFVGANGGVIENHGYADTNMKPTDDKGPEIRCRWDCAEVTRPLISTGVTCDSGYEVLHTKDAAMVVPAGALSSMLGSINVVQRYTRSGKGLYTTKMKMRAPKIPAAGFTRQSRQP